MVEAINVDEMNASQEDRSMRLVSYVGETARPVRERIYEHMQNLKNGNPKSFIISHWMEAHAHSTSAPVFDWKVIDSYNDALRRQLGEGLHILETGALNRKLEFNQNIICRMEVAVNDNPSDDDLKKELSKRKTYTDNLLNFIANKSRTTDAIRLF